MYQSPEVREIYRKGEQLGLTVLTQEEVQELRNLVDDSYLNGLLTGALAVAALACVMFTMVALFG